jgi:hypothetical protein
VGCGGSTDVGVLLPGGLAEATERGGDGCAIDREAYFYFSLQRTGKSNQTLYCSILDVHHLPLFKLIYISLFF